AISPDIEEEWKNKEISYLQKIEELKIAAGITETAKIEEMKRDIAFLNSIIAEQFKKEQDMKKQIAILNGIPANQIFMELQRKTFRDLPPRLYCDMCEVFDLHDTTDCPEQALDIMKNGIHENVHKVRPSPRAYCEECEEFGHDIECCQKRQTEKSEAKDCTF
ncbi:unnamed protein product, partial [Thelazia callipaeda]|uniref:CAP_C domain-containing protein n=1 Tax=Thelazia callipaeda TaxID=103827 RepID=A0A0N5D6B4_THECL